MTEDDAFDGERTGILPSSQIHLETRDRLAREQSSHSISSSGESSGSMGPAVGQTRPMEERHGGEEPATLETDPGKNPRLAHLINAPTAETPPEAAAARAARRAAIEEQPTPVESSPLLPEGEAEERPVPKPFSLRPKTDDARVGSTSGSSLALRRKERIRRVVWLGIGAIVGASAFAAGYLSSPQENAYPFAPVVLARDTGAKVGAAMGLPDGTRGTWSLQESYLFGFGEKSIHVLDAMHDPPKYLGTLATENSPLPRQAAVVGVPEVDGIRVAWFEGKEIHWTRLDGPATEAPESAAPSAAAAIPVPDVEEFLFAPVRIECWTEKTTERFLVMGRTNNHDFIMAIDPATGIARSKKLGELEVEGRIVAPAASFFDPATKKSLILLTTNVGAWLIEDDAGKGELRKLSACKFEKPWPEPKVDAKNSQAAAIARARLGPGAKGWIVAGVGGWAAMRLEPGPSLSVRAGELKSVDMPPTIVTYPNSDAPAWDEALIAHESESGNKVRGWRLQFAENGEPDELDEELISSQRLTCWDINGDGHAEIIAPNPGKRVKIFDGRTAPGQRLKAIPLPQDRDQAPEADGKTEIAWLRTGEAAKAFYFSEKLDPAKIEIPLQWKMGPELEKAWERDQRWRNGRHSF